MAPKESRGDELLSMLDPDPIKAMGTPLDELFSQFDPDPAKSEQKYQNIRKKLIKYFSAWRCPDPEDLADETILRLCQVVNKGKRFAGEEEIGKVVYGIAKNVRLEDHRKNEKHNQAELASVDDPKIESILAVSPDLSQIECLKQCWRKLPLGERALVIVYDHFDSREELSELLGISYGQLRFRVARIRSELRECKKDC